MICALTILLGAQMTTAELKELRKYRYGKTAAQIEAMGETAYGEFFEAKTPDAANSGVFRGVAAGVYVDAYRENTGRRYRAPLPPNVQARLLELDKQIRFIGVLFARTDWTLSGGGNAFDPEGDALSYAQAERQLYTRRTGKPDPAGVRRRIATFRAHSLARAPEAEGGIAGSTAKVRATVAANVAKIERALVKANGLCRTSAERAVLYEFVDRQAAVRD